MQGHRQHAIDLHAESGECGTFSREMIDAVPYPPDNPTAKLAHYAALARDGVSCNACHNMAVGAKDMAKVAGEQQNACLDERQERINPGLTGIARTFTGNFLLAPPGKSFGSFGPFEDPKDKTMTNALGFVPEHSQKVKSSELCASCHTVHLPVLHRGEIIGRTYEQATYPEWAFSSYRTGDTPDGPLPLGPGASPAKAAICRARTRKGSPIAARSRRSRNT